MASLVPLAAAVTSRAELAGDPAPKIRLEPLSGGDIIAIDQAYDLIRSKIEQTHAMDEATLRNLEDLEAISHPDPSRCTAAALRKRSLLKEANKDEPAYSGYLLHWLAQQVELCAPRFKDLLRDSIVAVQEKNTSVDKIDDLREIIEDIDSQAGLPSTSSDHMVQKEIVASLLEQALAEYMIKKGFEPKDSRKDPQRIENFIESHFGESIQAMRVHFGEASDLYREMKLLSPTALRNFPEKSIKWMIFINVYQSLGDHKYQTKNIQKLLPSKQTGKSLMSLIRKCKLC